MNTPKSSLAVIFLGLGLGVLLFAGAYWSYERKQKCCGNRQKENLYLASTPQKGSAQPLVELVEFFDPQCESCRAFHPVIKSLLKKYSKQVRLSLRYLAFHKLSQEAIFILEASRDQAKFWEVLESLYQYQRFWGGHHHPSSTLLWRVLAESGVDTLKIRQTIENKHQDFLSRLERDERLGKRLSVNQTPTFFVNGIRLQKLSEKSLTELIDAELSRKQEQ